MSDQLLLAVGTAIFGITVWATLAFGYWQFGAWYDRSQADEISRRKDDPTAREPRAIAHDDPDGLVDLSDNEVRDPDNPLVQTPTS